MFFSQFAKRNFFSSLLYNVKILQFSYIQSLGLINPFFGCFKIILIIKTSVSDPYHFDADTNIFFTHSLTLLRHTKVTFRIASHDFEGDKTLFGLVKAKQIFSV